MIAPLAEFKTFDHLRAAEAFAQAVAEIRDLTGWLLVQGCPCVALRGLSPGRWFAGLANGDNCSDSSVPWEKNAKCDPFGILLTSHWTGAVIIVQFPRTKSCIFTSPRRSIRPMPSSLAG
jgi:hypothetical protein